MEQGRSACKNFPEAVCALRDWRQWRLPLEAVGPLIALAIILIPAFCYGPWLPFTDFIAYSSVNSYPPSLSYGPDHYYLLQLTYILPVIISRLCVDLGLAVPYQVMLFYLIHALSYFLIGWFLLRRFITNPHVRNGALVVGALSFWDGQFLWGGPLAFSLGAVLGAWAIYLSIKEADRPEKNWSGLILLLILASVLSHPFMVPFGLLLYGVRLIFIPQRRLNSLVGIGLLLLYHVVIRNESPEPIPGPILSRLFGWYPEQAGERLHDLFQWNGEATTYLLGIDPLPLRIYFYALGLVHLIGFVFSPLAFWISRDKPGQRLFFAFGTLAGLLFFWSKMDNELIWWWPQRILTVYSGLTFVTGVVGPLVVLRWVQDRKPSRRFGFNRLFVISNWVLIGVTSVALIYCEIRVFRLNTILLQRYAELKAQIMESGLKDTELQLAGIYTQPFLRAAPFILFSDPDLIRRGILVSTEWHSQGRHPTRINPSTTLKKVPIVVQGQIDATMRFTIPRDPKPNFNPPGGLLPSK